MTARRTGAAPWHLPATLLIAGLALLTVPRLASWAIVHGVWSGDSAACRGEGACWLFLRAKLPLILFGIYPEGQRWRPLAASVLMVAPVLWSLPRAHWTRRAPALWIGGLAAATMLMAGGVAGLAPVPTTAWGGVPVTIGLTLVSLLIGLPAGVALALARRSTLPVVRWTATAGVELVRALPVVTLLFVAVLLLPLLLPEGVTADTLLRAASAFAVLAAAYFCEVIRGGLQAVPAGQEEAARALGLGRVAMLRLVILPQAFVRVLPPLTGTVIVIVKNTSLVLVIGLFDLVSAGRLALTDPRWPMPYAETFLFIGLVYFAICHGLSRYARHLERDGRRWTR